MANSGILTTGLRRGATRQGLVHEEPPTGGEKERGADILGIPLNSDESKRSLVDLDEAPLLPAVEFKVCPIKASLGVLGRKWTLLILRDIGFRKIGRFNELLRSVSGLTPRVLSMRLSELE